MLKFALPASTLCLMAFMPSTVVAQETSVPVVLELFTSQGCSDAPAADRLAAELVADKDKNITVLTCHVDFMDHGGWKDTLANNACKTRRGGYTDVLKISDAQVPQFVVNGIYGTVGQSDEDVHDVIGKAKNTDIIGNIGLRLGSDTLDIVMPEEKLEQNTDVWLLAFDREHVVEIKAGQNAGVSAKYVNVVKHIVKVMHWKGPAVSYFMDLKLVPAEGYTVIAQQKGLGKIIAASTITRNKKTPTALTPE